MGCLEGNKVNPLLRMKGQRIFCSAPCGGLFGRDRKFLVIIFHGDACQTDCISCHFYRMRADTFVTFKPGDLSRADSVFFGERILCDSLLLHCIPQVVIYNQILHLFILA